MLRNGEQVGPYTIGKHLVTGGCSEVYEASANGQLFALKILREGRRNDPLLPWRMTNEALVLSRIKHAGVVRLSSHGQHEDGRPYLVLELLHLSLERRLRVAPQEAVSLAESLARTLATLHALGIVHRDVKPQNAMLTEDGKAKLVDLGLAKLPVESSNSEEPLLP